MTRLLCATVALAMISGLPASKAETYKFDASKLRSLLDKDQSLRGQDRPRLTFGWVSKLQLHINACWHLPRGVTRAVDIEARVALALKPDGTLAGEPSIVEVTKHPLGKAFAENVVRAIKTCQPYSFLPADEYVGGWDKLDMTFSTDSDAKRARDRALIEQMRKGVQDQNQKQVAPADTK